MNSNTSRMAMLAGAVLLGAGIALPALYSQFGRSKVEEARYTTHADAQQAGRHSRLPSTLPRSASEIHEWYDGGTHVSLGSFRFDPRDRSAFEPTLRVGLRKPLRIDRDPSFATVLPRDPSEAQLATNGFEFYTEQDFAYAIRWRDGIAYYWYVPLDEAGGG